MAQYSESKLNNFSKKHLVSMILGTQEELGKLNDNMEYLIEQFSIILNNRFRWKAEWMDHIDGQLSFYKDEGFCDLSLEEPSPSFAK